MILLKKVKNNEYVLDAVTNLLKFIFILFKNKLSIFL